MAKIALWKQSFQSQKMFPERLKRSMSESPFCSSLWQPLAAAEKPQLECWILYKVI